MKTKPLMLALTSAAVLWCGPAAPTMSAQPVIPPPMPVSYQLLSDQQLDQLLAPIALYPDPLLAILLPAATQPAEIVLANRYVTGGGDPGQIDSQPWDPSVQALAHYPSVLQYMNDNLAWTMQLGQAFLYQQQQVMDSIQRLRVSAQNYGNLVSTPQAEVVNYGGDIQILPAEPDVIYVPVYQPAYIYYRSGFFWGFNACFSIGPWLNCDFDWHRHNLCFWDRDHPRSFRWWQERPEWRDNWLAREGNVWHPGDHRDGDRNHWGNRDNRDNRNDAWDHRDNRDNRDWNRSSDRNWNRAENNPPASRNNNPVVWMSHPGASPRPTATPRPAAGRPGGSIYVVNPSAPAPAPTVHQPQRGAPDSSQSWRGTGNFNRGRDTMPTFSRPQPTRSAPTYSAPTYSAPARSEPARNAPAYSAPVHFEPAHAAPSAPSVSYSRPAPSFQGGGGGGGGGSHGASSQPQSSSRH